MIITKIKVVRRDKFKGIIIKNGNMVIKEYTLFRFLEHADIYCFS